MDGWIVCLFVLRYNALINIFFSHVGTDPSIDGWLE